MSNYYATFRRFEDASDMLEELVRGGVRAEDLSLVVPRADQAASSEGLQEVVQSVGDATSFVGRSDDPRVDELPEADGDYSKYTTLEVSPVSPMDTSDPSTDVDEVDQMEESQEVAEEMMYPLNEESYGQHERDDLDLAMLTGYSQAIPIQDDVKDTESIAQNQGEESLPMLIVSGFGKVIGAGDLATAALDWMTPGGWSEPDTLVRYLQGEGITQKGARLYRDACLRGECLLAVAVSPGSLNEAALEAIAERHHAENAALVDVARY